MAIKNHLSLGRVKGHRASEIVTGLLKIAFPHLRPGRTPIDYEDTTATYLIDVEGRILKSEAPLIVEYVRGIVATLVHLDLTKHCGPESEYGILTKMN
jgi:hypothetical protein